MPAGGVGDAVPEWLVAVAVPVGSMEGRIDVINEAGGDSATASGRSVAIIGRPSSMVMTVTGTSSTSEV